MCRMKIICPACFFRKKNIMKKLILLLTTLCLFAVAQAYDFESDGIYYNITTDSTVSVTYKVKSTSTNSCPDTTIIPESVTDTSTNTTYTVTSIGEYSFYYCNNLDSISIPNTVTSIGQYSFYSCKNLNSVSIPNSVTYIGSAAFWYAQSLKKFVMPNSVISIGQNLMGYCTALTSVTLSNKLETLNYNAFLGCSNLTSVTIPSSVTTIRINAFEKCTSLVAIDVDSANTSFSSEDGVLFNKAKTTLLRCPADKSGDYIVPSTVTVIGEEAFYYCRNLTSVALPNSLKSILEEAFSTTTLTSLTLPSSLTYVDSKPFCQSYKLTSLEVDAANTNFCSIDGVLFNKDTTTLVTSLPYKTGAYTIPSTVEKINDYAFDHCRYIDSIFMSNEVTSIGTYAFNYCSILKYINLSDSISQISTKTFYYCQKLKSVTIPRKVTKIDYYAFYCCTSLATFYVENSTPDSITLGTSAFKSVNSSCVLNVPTGSKSLYAAADQWKDFKYIEEPSCPVISSTAPADTAVVGEKYTYTVSASDANGETLTYTLTNAPGDMVITNSKITWTPSEGTTTSGEVTLTVSDGDSSVVQKFTLAVLNAPIISSATTDTIISGEQYTYAIIATDADGDSLTYTLRNTPDNMTINGNVITWTPTDTVSTVYRVYITVTDGLYSTTQTNYITVSLATRFKEVENIEALVYPNPVESIVTVKSETDIERIQVLATSGATVISERVNASEAQLNLGALQSGIYFLKLNTAKGSVIKQIIKQ